MPYYDLQSYYLGVTIGTTFRLHKDDVIMLEHFVLPDGRLDYSKLWCGRHEILYKGLGGRDVERFYISRDQSYIFKPVTQQGQQHKERWVHDHVLAHFPPIYPRIVTRSRMDTAPQNSWLILEDAGPLKHTFTMETAQQVAKHAAWWHALPRASFPELGHQGPKPAIAQMKKHILKRQNEVVELLSDLPLDEQAIQLILQLLHDYQCPSELVMSHGDLHLGNYAQTPHGLVILDWEHAHWNTRHWDLIHLLDMSHPLFPKRITPDIRKQVLHGYLAETVLHGSALDAQSFMQQYMMSVCVLSLWMLLLIETDLRQEQEPWPKPALRRQRIETTDSLIQCTTELLKDIDKGKVAG